MFRFVLAGAVLALSSLAVQGQEQTDAQRLAFRCNYAAAERGLAINGAPHAAFVKQCVDDGEAAAKAGNTSPGAAPQQTAPAK